MPIEGHYKELVDGYELIKSISGITCTRKFIDSDPTATGSLPVIGDLLDATDASLAGAFVTQIRITKHGNVPTNQLYVVSYSNSPDVDPETAIKDPDNLPISGGMSAEAINIDGEKTGTKEKWFWKNGDTCDQQLFRKIVTGTFKVTRRLASLQLKLWAQFAGKINDDVFKIGGDSFVAGLVMFEGVEHEEYRNNNGERRFKVGYTFTIKAQPIASGGYVGWNYNYNPVSGKFEEVVYGSNTGTTNLYQTANLGLLLAGTEEP